MYNQRKQSYRNSTNFSESFKPSAGPLGRGQARDYPGEAYPYSPGVFPAQNPPHPRAGGQFPPLAGHQMTEAYGQVQPARPEAGKNYSFSPLSAMNRKLLIEDAIEIARMQVPGEVVSAELERKKGRLLFEIDIVSNEGPVYEVEVDALTGEVISVELD